MKLVHFAVFCIFIAFFSSISFGQEFQIIRCPSEQAGANFGIDIDVSGNFAVVGSRFDYSDTVMCGAAYVLEFEQNEWIVKQKLVPSDGADDDIFGHSVAIYGNTIVIGSRRDDDMGFNSGSAYIFEYSSGEWIEKQKITASDGHDEASFGTVSIWDNTIAVGSQHSSQHGTRSGSLYIFEKENNIWIEKQILLPDDVQEGDEFGNNSLHENYLVVGAHLQDNPYSNSGTAYIFEKQNDTWNLMDKIEPMIPYAEMIFGHSVAIENRTIVIGASKLNANTTHQGAAYVFQRSGTSWIQTQVLMASDYSNGARFGTDVKIADGFIGVGAPFNHVNGISTGTTYLFGHESNNYTEIGLFTPDSLEEGILFGGSVAMDMGSFFAGTPSDNQNGYASGSVYIYHYYFATTWSTELQLSDGSTRESATIKMGQGDEATDGIDENFGEIELPPLPPAGTYDIRFELPQGEQSMVDIRNSSLTELQWRILIQPGTAGYPVTIQWDPETLPEGTVIMRDETGNNLIEQEMHLTDQIVIDNPAVTSLTIDYEQVFTRQSYVDAGFNLVSTPVISESMFYLDLYPAAISNAFYFDNGYVIEDSLKVGKGYWLKFAAPDTFQITGEKYLGDINISEGWNIVAAGESVVSTDDITTNPAGLLTSPFFGYHGSYDVVDELVPGKAYWVKSTGEGQLLIGQATEKNNPADNITGGEEALIITDNSGRSGKIYLVNAGQASRYELPPAPPESAFDVRTRGGYAAVENSLLNDEIKISGAEYPINISMKGTDITLTYLSSSGMVTEHLKDGEFITITDPSVELVKISSVDQVSDYNLIGNYPNPFNPATKIKYSIPEGGNVTIRIFDILGREVDAVRNIQDAGSYEIQFSAKGLASGVYFYRMEVSSISGNNLKYISPSRKMIVLK